MDGYQCELCGRTFKSASGLSGHKQLQHGSAKAEISQDPDTALAEILTSVRESLDQVQAQVDGLKGQLDATNQRLTDFQYKLPSAAPGQGGAVMVTVYEQCQEEVKALTEQVKAVKAELNDWQIGKTFLAFDPALHADHTDSAPKLKAYVDEQVKALTDSELNQVLRDRGCMPALKTVVLPKGIALQVKPDTHELRIAVSKKWKLEERGFLD